jgi:hypothetical protein
VAERDRALAVAERNRKAEPAARHALDALRQARDALAAAGAPSAAEAADVAAAITQADAATPRWTRASTPRHPRHRAPPPSDLRRSRPRSPIVEREPACTARGAAKRGDHQEQEPERCAAALETREQTLLSTLTSAEEHAAKGESGRGHCILESALPGARRRIADASGNRAHSAPVRSSCSPRPRCTSVR